MKRRDQLHPPRHPQRRRPPLRRSRWRGLLKWSGTLACLLILLAAAACLRWSYRANVGGRLLLLERGRFVVTWVRGLGSIVPRTARDKGWRAVGEWEEAQDRREPLFEMLDSPDALDLYGYGEVHFLRLPLWMPFVLIGLPTAWLWWRDRRRIPAGCCAGCGYDLTGNVSGRCPECGALRESRSGESDEGQDQTEPRP